jgi:hypothetical protein
MVREKILLGERHEKNERARAARDETSKGALSSL